MSNNNLFDGNFSGIGSPGMMADLKEELSPKVALMQHILRFLQLLCENHNQALQVLLFPPWH